MAAILDDDSNERVKALEIANALLEDENARLKAALSTSRVNITRVAHTSSVAPKWTSWLS